MADAEEMLRDLCGAPLLEKVRHEVPDGEDVWEVDVYGGVDTGLALAEIELTHVDEAFERPPWIGPEVTGDPNFGHERFARSRSFAGVGRAQGAN